MKTFQKPLSKEEESLCIQALQAEDAGRKSEAKRLVIGRNLRLVEHIAKKSSREEELEELKKFDSEDLYVIGGEQIYHQNLTYCNTANKTKIDHAYEADAYFPNLDEKEEWKITATSDEQTYFDLEYTFVKYERKDK